MAEKFRGSGGNYARTRTDFQEPTRKKISTRRFIRVRVKGMPCPDENHFSAVEERIQTGATPAAEQFTNN